jgi:hypothetical protein
MLQIELKNKQT